MKRSAYHKLISPLDLRQKEDVDKLIPALEEFIDHWKKIKTTGAVSKGVMQSLPDVIVKDPYPMEPNSLDSIMKEIKEEVLPYIVKTSHPLFLGYVTPASLDITWVGNAIIAMLNQNVSFASLSPAGTAIEKYVIQVICQKIIGYTALSGGVFTSGGSAANLHAMLLARYHALGQEVTTKGIYASSKPLRIYCSEQIHRSIHKAAMLMGIGIENVVEIPCDEQHKIILKELKKAIKKDRKDGYTPIAIVGAAGTRVAGSFDNLKALSDIAEKENMWFHIDGAYGAFLRLADNGPDELKYINLAHSVTLDPHKLFFMPFDSGCLLVKDNQKLLDTFATEGEYLEKYHAVGSDYCDYGMQLGRSMKAFNVWLALKYFGLNTYKKEYEKLIQLACEFKRMIVEDGDLELIGPSESIVVCFRIKIKGAKSISYNNRINNETIENVVKKGNAFINKVKIENIISFRVCFSNYKTNTSDLFKLLKIIKNEIP